MTVRQGQALQESTETPPVGPVAMGVGGRVRMVMAVVMAVVRSVIVMLAPAGDRSRVVVAVVRSVIVMLAPAGDRSRVVVAVVPAGVRVSASIRCLGHLFAVLLLAARHGPVQDATKRGGDTSDPERWMPDVRQRVR
ncbi:MAG TPA: hypothetical protein VLM76_07240 [Patescibacteria group bacterium]|nr:hypothetical protein [Patescibacteria group bacterium]